MKTSSTIVLISLFASTLLSAGPVVKAAVLNNTGNPNNSVVNKAVKVNVAKNVIDPSDGIVEKTVKAKAVRGDYRTKRKVKREVR